ncbi:MAG: prepilin-type N-terminal cleavage/methylation domain-containing protein [Sedimentisphaerales bacterium]
MQYAIRNTNTAFTLVEVMTALVILAIISVSVLVVINRCIACAADSALRMQAFEVARDNMENILSKDSVEEMVEYGSSDKYPEIKWQSTVEAFYEPAAEQIWVRGVCSAEYTGTAGDVQTVELTHWLTGLTKEQIIQMIEEKQKEKEQKYELGEPNEVNEPNKVVVPNEANKPAEVNKPNEQGYVDLICGHTREEIVQMPMDELYQLLLNCE